MCCNVTSFKKKRIFSLKNLLSDKKLLDEALIVCFQTKVLLMKKWLKSIFMEVLLL